VFRPQPSGLIQFAGLARNGGHTSIAEPAAWLCPNRSARLPCKTADLAIAKAVVDEAEELSRRGDAGDHDAASLGDALEGGLDGCSTVVTGDRLDRCPADEVASLAGDVAAIIVASLIIAACSLAVNIVAGLGDRKRPFSLLRLTGVPTALLHRVVTLESALPLLLVAAVSIVVGLVSAALYLHSQVGIAFRIPGIAYWATVLGGLAASLAIIASTFPLLDRMTGPEVARNE